MPLIVMVLMLENPRPRSPSALASLMKPSVTEVASSMACAGTVAPPMSTVSTPTSPLALEESP